jgi:EAL domain-containing protein (putative c-di-GMP-specific phosphodiesterase class I)/GGDEF domain-containing protein
MGGSVKQPTKGSQFNGPASAQYASMRRRVLAVTCLLTAPSLAISLVNTFNGQAFFVRTGWASLIICSLIGLTAVMLMTRILRPIAAAANALDALISSAELEAAPGQASELESFARNANWPASRLLGLRQRLLNQHPGTGLPTREPFLADLAKDMERDPGPTLLALVRLCDFDRMTAFDRPAAETALSAFGARLAGAVRNTLRLAQVDRDCFAIWFRSTAVSVASDELRSLSYVLEQDLAVGGQNFSPVISVGAALYPDDAAQPAALLACAFAALPKSASTPKSPGPAFFSSTSTQTERKRFAMEQSLRKAIGEDQFVLHYQPVVDLELGRAVGAEALLRWRHPDLGLVSPGEFIPILEQSGLIDEVGLWVLNTACREARAWRLSEVGELRLSVNISARQFRGPSLAMTVVRMLERHRLAPHDLELELTETAAMQDAGRTIEVLGQLRSLGVGVAIDDFGAGYSSLSYLKNLPFTKLKIDREFVVDVHERPDSRAICAALVALARGLNIELLAEGVEKPEEVAALLALGCTKFQGYYFARPLSAPTLIETVTNPQWIAGLSRAGHAPAAQRRLA